MNQDKGCALSCKPCGSAFYTRAQGVFPVLPTTLRRVCVASVLEITFQPGPRVCMRGALLSKPGCTCSNSNSDSGAPAPRPFSVRDGSTLTLLRETTTPTRLLFALEALQQISVRCFSIPVINCGSQQVGVPSRRTKFGMYQSIIVGPDF